MNDCRLRSLTLLGLMESNISRVRPQRVYDLAVNLTPPMSPLLMLQLLHYLAAFLYLCFCQDLWGKCPAALTALEINDFIKKERGCRKCIQGENKFSWVYNESKHEAQSTVTSLAHSRKVTSLEKYDSQTPILMKRLPLFTPKWLEEAGWKLKTLSCIQELCDLPDNIRKISSC